MYCNLCSYIFQGCPLYCPCMHATCLLFLQLWSQVQSKICCSGFLHCISHLDFTAIFPLYHTDILPCRWLTFALFWSSFFQHVTLNHFIAAYCVSGFYALVAPCLSVACNILAQWLSLTHLLQPPMTCNAYCNQSFHFLDYSTIKLLQQNTPFKPFSGADPTSSALTFLEACNNSEEFRPHC